MAKECTIVGSVQWGMTHHWNEWSVFKKLTPSGPESSEHHQSFWSANQNRVYGDSVDLLAWRAQEDADVPSSSKGYSEDFAWPWRKHQLHVLASAAIHPNWLRYLMLERFKEWRAADKIPYWSHPQKLKKITNLYIFGEAFGVHGWGHGVL